jgi:hypothetical protein
MRSFLLLVAVVASIASAGSATAATRPINATVTLDVTDQGCPGCCCAWVWHFEGTATIPSVGRVDVIGSYTIVYLGSISQIDNYLSLELTAPDGDTLAIEGNGRLQDGLPLPHGPIPWTLTNATGHFSGYSGSGTWTIIDVAPLSTTLTLMLTGTISDG